MWIGFRSVSYTRGDRGALPEFSSWATLLSDDFLSTKAKTETEKFYVHFVPIFEHKNLFNHIASVAVDAPVCVAAAAFGPCERRLYAV